MHYDETNYLKEQYADADYRLHHVGGQPAPGSVYDPGAHQPL